MTDMAAAAAARDCPDIAVPRDCRSAARIVVFAARRTGSSYLVDLIRASANVRMHGEIFHVPELSDLHGDGYVGGEPLPCAEIFERRRRDPQSLLRFVQCHSGGHRAVGIKVFRDHLKNKFWPVLTNWCSVCVVLRRDNVDAQYRSLLVARRTGQWKGKTSQQAVAAASRDRLLPRIWDRFHLNVSMDPFERNTTRLSWRQNQEAWYRNVRRQLRRRGHGVRVVELSFERHLVGQEGGPNLTSLWAALGVQPPLARVAGGGALTS